MAQLEELSVEEQLENRSIEELRVNAMEYAQQGDISSANRVVETFERQREYNLTLGSKLHLLRRSIYREYIGYCLDAAESELDEGQLDAAEKYLNIARDHSLELNGPDGRNLWRKHPPLYTRLEELGEASA